MRILRLDFIKYGKFENVQLDFGQLPQALHIIYGDNEAGKSTAMRALTGLFYGIHPQTKDGFRFKNDQLRIGASLVTNSGTIQEFVRRKGSKDTLLDKEPGGQILTEQKLSEFLHFVGKEQFAKYFHLDHEEVRGGGNDLVLGKGDLAESLFAAGAGVSNLHAILQSLRTEADRLYRKTGTSTISQLKTQWEAQSKLSKELMVPSATFTRMSQELFETEMKLKGISIQLKETDVKLTQLGRVKRCWSDAKEWARICENLEMLGGVPLLPPDTHRLREAAQRAFTGEAERARLKQNNIDELNNQINELKIDRRLLKAAKVIEEDLSHRLGAHLKERDDLPSRRGELRQIDKNIQDILNDLAPGKPLDDVDNLVVSLAVRQSIGKLCEQVQEIHIKRQTCKTYAEELNIELNATENRLAGTSKNDDPVKLKTAIHDAISFGDLDGKLREIDIKLMDARDVFRQSVGRLGLWTGSADECQTLAVPMDETVNEFIRIFSEMEVNKTNLRNRTTDNLNKTHQFELDYATLNAVGSVPTESELLESRSDRDRGWSHIKAVWLGSTPVTEFSDWTDGNALDVTFEAAMRRTDDIGDGLRRESDRVAQAATLRVQIADLTKRYRELTDDVVALEQRERALHEEWISRWKPIGIDPLPPIEMRGWLSRFEKLKGAANEVERLERTRLEIQSNSARVVSFLSRALNTALSSAPMEMQFPGQLLQIAQNELDQIISARTARKNMLDDKSRITTSLQKSERESNVLDEELKRWKANWAAAMTQATMASSTAPKHALESLERLNNLRNKLDARKAELHRVEQMEVNAKKLAEDVQLFCAELAPDIESESVEVVIPELQSRLANSKTNFEVLKVKEGLRDVLRKEHSDHIANVDIANFELQSLMKQANCTTIADMRKCEEQSAEKILLIDRKNQLERTLQREDKGSNIADFVERCLSHDPDTLGPKIEDVQSSKDDLESQRSPLDQTLGRLKTELGAIDGSDAAAQAAFSAQETLAQMQTAVERFTQIRLATLILDRSIEEHRRKNQDPLLARAGEIFSAITLGSFNGLRVDTGNEKPVIKGVRDNSVDNDVDVSGMSEGTRDQLYLSMRLAGLERQINEGAEPVPFIVDDILIKFDDQRSLATLEILAQLAKRCQILFFTHHPRLVDLAKQLPSGTPVMIHRLRTSGNS